MILSALWALLGVVGICIHTLLYRESRIDLHAVEARSHIGLELLVAESELRLQRHLLTSACFFTMSGILALLAVVFGIEYADIIRRLLILGGLFGGFATIVYAGLRRRHDRNEFFR